MPSFRKKQVRVRGPFLCKRVAQLEDEMEIEWLFFSDSQKAEQCALDLMVEAVNVIEAERQSSI
jgi:hypothetical protein